MKIIVHELEASAIEQRLTPSKNTIVEALRPHIYRHNFPTGSLKLQILDMSDTLVGESENVDISDIGSENFFHGYVRFLINAYLAKDTTYKFQLVGEDGYTFDESAYCGWCNAYDLAKYPTPTTPLNSLHHSLDIEIWERKVR